MAKVTSWHSQGQFTRRLWLPFHWPFPAVLPVCTGSQHSAGSCYMERSTKMVTERGLWPTADGASSQQLIKKWMWLPIMCVNLEADPFPFEPSDETADLADILDFAFWPYVRGTQLSGTWIPDSQTLWGQ